MLLANSGILLLGVNHRCSGVVTVGSVYGAINVRDVLDIAQHVRQDVVQFLVLLFFI